MVLKAAGLLPRRLPYPQANPADLRPPRKNRVYTFHGPEFCAGGAGRHRKHTCGKRGGGSNRSKLPTDDYEGYMQGYVQTAAARAANIRRGIERRARVAHGWTDYDGKYDSAGGPRVDWSAPVSQEDRKQREDGRGEGGGEEAKARAV